MVDFPDFTGNCNRMSESFAAEMNLCLRICRHSGRGVNVGQDIVHASIKLDPVDVQPGKLTIMSLMSWWCGHYDDFCQWVLVVANC